MKNAQTITAVPSFPGRAIFGKLQARLHNWQVRRKIRALGDLEDRMLQDIGVTRDDIYWASRLPTAMNSAHELERASQLRRRKVGGADTCIAAV
ncbi:MAG: DUF1127 domain-containing protein [Hyphomicrobiales bacterium]